MTEVKVKEHPIIFSTDMVKAILDGRKTQTRRLIKDASPEENLECGFYTPALIDKNGEQYPANYELFGAYTLDGEYAWKCPYGQVGDRLWVRETWQLRTQAEECQIIEDWYILYKDACTQWVNPPELWLHRNRDNLFDVWRPSIFMPRWASRITLEITGIRVERLQEITEKDARAEGINQSEPWGFPDGYINSFAWLWDSLNAKRGYGWEVNPWVWVIEFKKL